MDEDQVPDDLEIMAEKGKIKNRRKSQIEVAA